MTHVIFQRQILWNSAAAALPGLAAGCASLECKLLTARVEQLLKR